MPRQNRRGRRPQRIKLRTVMNSHGTLTGGGRADASGVKLEPLIKSDGNCYNPRTSKVKIAFNTEEKAALALSAARKNHKKLGHTERIEQRYYLCPLGATGGADQTHYHLTHVPVWPTTKEVPDGSTGEPS